LSQYTQQREQEGARPFLCDLSEIGGWVFKGGGLSPSLVNNLGNSVAPSATISVSFDFSRPIILDIGNEKIDLNVLIHSLQLFLVLSILLQLEVNFLAFMHFGLQKFGEEPFFCRDVRNTRELEGGSSLPLVTYPRSRGGFKGGRRSHMKSASPSCSSGGLSNVDSMVILRTSTRCRVYSETAYDSQICCESARYFFTEPS